MTQVSTVPAVTAAFIAEGKVTVITAAERGADGRVLIRAGGGSGYALPRLMAHANSSLIASDPRGGGIIVHPGCIVASGTVEWVPITDDPDVWPDLRACVLVAPGAAWFYAEGEDDDPTLCLAGQLPYGDFRPGRWAGILTDVQPTTERCPACWGAGVKSVWARTWTPCELCCGHGETPPIPCDDVKEWP